MKSFKTYPVVILLIFVAFTSAGQSAQNSNSLQNQFIELKEKSNTYQEYKVVKITSLNNFWKNVYDSLNVVRQKLGSFQKEIDRQNKELISLKQEIVKRDNSLASGEYEKAHITVLGIDMLKSTYIYISWSIIGVLVLLMTIAYLRYKKSNNIAYSKTKDYEALSHELNDFKQKAREKELKVGRELQTERNKVEELNQKIVSLKKQVHL
ncbi:MAG TPA: hypothetical protein VD908_19940 [Cytophagales bacterium]|nr:hypothetical protein [Cytophagales bacterium]